MIIKKFNEMVDYLKLYNDFKLTNQYWFAKLKDGSIINCGYGFLEGEFGPETFNKMAKAAINNGENELIPVDGFYTFDGATDVKVDGENKHIEDIYYNTHPEDDSFILVPKDDIVKKWFIIKQKTKPIKISVNK